MKPSKYRNRITTVGGIKFHSKKEALRWLVLKDREKHGEIRDLQRQVPFDLKVGGPGHSAVVGKLIIDFAYIEKGHLVGEDSKGYQTAESKLKMKLAAVLYPLVEWRLS